MGSKDNMTVLIVKFSAQKVGAGGGVQARRQLRNSTPANEEGENDGENPADASS